MEKLCTGEIKTRLEELGFAPISTIYHIWEQLAERGVSVSTYLEGRFDEKTKRYIHTGWNWCITFVDCEKIMHPGPRSTGLSSSYKEALRQGIKKALMELTYSKETGKPMY